MVQAIPLLFCELNDELVRAALERMKRGSAPGKDGIPVEVYQSFPDIFAPGLLQAMQVFLQGGGVTDVPFVNRPFESEIHGTVNFTYFCYVLLVTWCHRVLLSCYLRPK